MAPSGCSAVQCETQLVCLAHLEEQDWQQLLSSLAPGSDLDARGVIFDDNVWEELAIRFTDSDTGALKFGVVLLDQARLPGDVRFDNAQFVGNASFDSTHFSGDASFTEVRFDGDALFLGSRFAGNARFDGTRFAGEAEFVGTEVAGSATFKGADFVGTAGFDCLDFNEASFAHAHFGAVATFRGAHFSLGVNFAGARFDGDMWFTFVCDAGVSLDGVKVGPPVRIQIASQTLSLTNARFDSAVALWLRYAEVELRDINLAESLTVVSVPRVFNYERLVNLSEDGLSGDSRAWIASLEGVDASRLILSDVDLSRCLFDGAYNLDQIRFEGRCTFAQTPRGWKTGRALPPIRRWTSRKCLTEEHQWRAHPEANNSVARAGWNGDPDLPQSPATAVATLAVIYRQLRKALEDGKDEPGAADFYYGEMEFRRHDPQTPRGERALLFGYWLLSGYALRATRALGFLLVAMTVTLLLTMAWGLPDKTPVQQLTGTMPAPGAEAQFAVNTPDAQLTLPFRERFSSSRADQASLVVVNSVVFRSSGQNLTTPGTWIEMASRISEPVLLGFAAVAARGRVKR